MSNFILSLRDAARAIHGAIDDLRLDYMVAALSADPETIEELHDALARFLPAASERAFLAGWSSGLHVEASVAELAIIDLSARLVAIQSADFETGPSGGVGVIDSKGREVGVPYHLADDWLFTQKLEGWQALADERRRARMAAPPIDSRAVLYGQLCPFIAEACWTATETATGDDAARAAISGIHARWLTTPRPDLAGQAPRDVLLARHNHLTWDLQDRCHQWSAQLRCPRGLSAESTAYRYGGYGTHEIVVYYYLVRFLICDCWERRAGADRPARDALVDETRRLEALRDEWLAAPNFEEFSGQTPALVIAHERARIPEGGTGKEHMVDCDCPLCQMMADDPAPMFWHLDGCNMDNDFAFSMHQTREQWEAEQRRYEEFSRRMDEESAARQAGQPPSVWQRSFVSDEAVGESPALAIFGLGAHLAELTQDLKEAGAEQATIDDLNRGFGNLRDAAADPSAALVEPVIARMNESLAAVAEAHPTLEAKCADLERQLRGFGRRLTEEPFENDEDVPF